MDTSAINKTGIEDLKKVISDKFGGWPLLEGDSWKEGKHNLTQLLIKLHIHQLPGLFHLSFHQINLSRNFIVPLLMGPQLSFPEEFFNKNFEKDRLKNKTMNSILHFGRKETTNKAIDEIIEFEIKLFQCFSYEGTAEEFSQNEIILDELKKKFEKTFNFQKFFESIFKKSNINLQPNEIIGTYVMPYLSCLSKLLESIPKRTIVNYLIWKVVLEADIALPGSLQGSVDFPKPRSKICAEYINTYLQKGVGYMYILKNDRYKNKMKVIKMIIKLKKSYATLISNQKWLQGSTKAKATKKLKSMIEYVSFPESLTDKQLIEEEFKEMKLEGKSFAEVFFKVRVLALKRELRLLRYPVSREMPDMPIATVNAFYEYSKNVLVVPAAFIEAPFYSNKYPEYLNMGGIGFFLGHEMTHGFDTRGYAFDYDGSSKDWWKEEDKMEFTNKSECFVRQYNDLILEQINEKVNGKMTLAENIADSGGLRIAYSAYKKWLRRHGEEKQLAGLPYNSEQMFFIAFARNFCQKVIPKFAEIDIATDNHSPNIFRVNMPLKNLKAFSTAFGCNRSSGMVLRKRCRIW